MCCLAATVPCLPQADRFEWVRTATAMVDQPVGRIAFTPDGVVGAVGMADGVVSVFKTSRDAVTLRNVTRHAARIVWLQFSADGSQLFSAAEDGSIARYSVGDGQSGGMFAVKAPLMSVAISADNTVIATASADKSVTLLDARTGARIRSVSHGSKKPFIALGFIEKDTGLIAVGQAGALLQWDVKTGRIIREAQESDRSIRSAFVGHTGSFFIIGTEVADFQKGGFGQVPTVGAGMPSLGRAGTGGPLAGTARPGDIVRENRIKLYEVGRGSVAKSFEGIGGAVVAVALSPDDRFSGFIRQAIRDSFVVVYDNERGVEIASARLPASGLGIGFSDDGQWLGVTTDHGHIILWAVQGVSSPITPDSLRGTTFTITSRDKRPLLAPFAPERVAVLDFAAFHLDEATGRAVADLVRVRIGEGENVRLVERGRFDAIMSEQAVSNSDRFDTATAVRLGRLLGAAKLVVGSVSKLDTRLTITVRMIDTETGAIDGQREISCEPCGVPALQEAVVRLQRVLVK
jgi:WD40 repeat protein